MIINTHKHPALQLWGIAPLIAKGYKRLAIALLSSLLPTFWVQAQLHHPTAEDSIEIIEVRGILASMKASINSKRFADAVIDTVKAEDIGKFPDSDVAEALARVPGVAVNRQFGQGQQVSIRGASNQLTSTLLNGHTIASTGWFDQQATDRSFNYSLLPPEMVGEIEVYKSSQADIAEGGVGGTVIINSRKPLDLEANSIFFSTHQDYGSVSEQVDPEFSGLYSWKSRDESFGVLLAVADAQTRYQRNGIESQIGWGDIVPTTFEQQRERTAFNAAIQYQASDNLLFGLDVMRLDMQANNANTSLFLMFPDDKDAACEQRNEAGTCIFYRRDADDVNPGWAQTWVREASMDSNTYDLDFTYENDHFTLEGLLGNTQSEGGTNTTANYGFWLGQASDFAGTYDATGDVINIDIADKTFDADDFNGPLAPESWSLRKQPNSDQETYAKLDFTLPVELGLISAFKMGVSWADHDVKQESFEGIVNPNVMAKHASAYYSGTVSSGGGFVLPKPIFDAMLNDAKAAISHFDSEGQVYKSGYGTIKEENLAVYVMANFESERWRGNMGLRYVETHVASDFYQLNADGQYADELSTLQGHYRDILPSINLAYHISDSVIIRAAAAKVISRPNYDDMFASSALAGFADGIPNNEVVDKGNVALDPFQATQAELGAEWYFNSQSLLAATYFIKRIDSFVTSEQLLDQSIGIVDPDTGDDNWTVSTKKNGSGGHIQGIELQLQSSFDNGLGYAVNYTFADSDAPASYYPDQLGVFSDSSKHTVNLVTYYETDDFSTRLAYNWRSEYMIRELPGYYGNREHQAYGTVDFSSAYHVTDYLALTFEVVNLLAADSVQLGVAPESADVKPEFKNNYPVFSAEGEARYKLGLAVRF